jgi:hypothetical protein
LTIELVSTADWIFLATAVGTLALAIATFLMAKKTAEAAETSKDLVRLERDQLRQAYLPVVVPVIERLQVAEVRDVAQSGTQLDSGEVRVTVPVANIGVGPALGVDLDIYWLDQVGNRSVAPQPMRIPAKIGGLAPGSSWEMQARFRGLATPPLPFRVSLTYSDTSGIRYLTRGRYFPEEELFRELTVSTLDLATGEPTSTQQI